MKISDYQILSGKGTGHLEAAIRERIAQGWQLLGYPICPQPGWFAQGIFIPAEPEKVVNAIAYAEGKNVGDITIKVEERLEEGWVPIGGLTVAQVNGETRYYQMMGNNIATDSTNPANE